MITPNKHLKLEISVINISTTILASLIVNSPQKYDELYNAVIYKHSEKAKVNFLPALDFLYLIRKIKYLKDLDSFEINK